MDSYDNIINYLIVGIIVIVIVNMLYKNLWEKNSAIEQMTEMEYLPEELSKDIQLDPIVSSGSCCGKPLKRSLSIPGYNGSKLAKDVGIIGSPEYDCNSACCNNYNYHDLLKQKYIHDDSIECPHGEPPQTIKGFHKDFFNFRDKTHINSQQHLDPVDKVRQLYLEGNTSLARGHQGIKIKDLFDSTTCGPNLYDRQCVRLPDFKHMNHDGYYVNHGSPGMYMTRDNWTYNEERVMNGGCMANGNIQGYDKESYTNLAALK